MANHCDVLTKYLHRIEDKYGSIVKAPITDEDFIKLRNYVSRNVQDFKVESRFNPQIIDTIQTLLKQGLSVSQIRLQTNLNYKTVSNIVYKYGLMNKFYESNYKGKVILAKDIDDLYLKMVKTYPEQVVGSYKNLKECAYKQTAVYGSGIKIKKVVKVSNYSFENLEIMASEYQRQENKIKRKEKRKIYQRKYRQLK